MTVDACLDETVTNQLLLGTLPAEIAESAEEHLLNCDSCLARIQATSRFAVEDELLRSLRAEPETTLQPPGLEPLVEELEKLGSSAQIAASAHEEIRKIVGKPHADDELGRLAHFRILEVLGAGGMGIVFKAEDGNLNRIVAVKAMRPSLAVDPEAKHRFRREAMAVAAFEHDHVVTVYQVEEDNGIPFFAMQWLEGESLRHRLLRDGKLSVSESLRITREIATGLAAAHERGLLHRDIKPDNVWLQAPGGRVKILDFGLVRSIEERSSLTHSGAILGTPEYMAPEQACGEEVDERCDLFSVGCVLYHMLTGQPPFRERNVVATLVAVSNARVEPPHVVDKQIPRDVSELTAKLLKRAPEERISSARALVERTDELEAKTRVKRSASNGKRKVWALLALGAAAILAGIIALQTQGGTLYVDADDSVTATIEGDSIQLADKATGERYQLHVGKNKLRPGEYEIVARNEESGLEFSARQFSIRRGNRKDLLVWLAQNENVSGSFIASSPQTPNSARENVQRRGWPVPHAVDVTTPGASVEPTPNQILDMLEQDPRYVQIVTAIQQNEEELMKLQDHGKPDADELARSHADVIDQEISRLERKRDAYVAEMRPQIIERIKAAEETPRGREIGPRQPDSPDARVASDTSATTQAEVPEWLTGTSDRLKIEHGNPLSPLALVQAPAERPQHGFSSWTYESPTHRGAINDLCTSPSGEFLATAGADGTVRIWQQEKLFHVIVVPDSEWGVKRIAWSTTGELLAAASDKSLTIWDVSDLRMGPRFVGQIARKVDNLSWSGSVLAMSDNDGVHIWSNGKILPNAGMTGSISSLSWSHDGRYLACREQQSVRIWDMIVRRVQATINIQSEDGFDTGVMNPVFSSTFNYIAFAKILYRTEGRPGHEYAGSRVLIYDATTGTRVKSFFVDVVPRWLAWNPNSDGLTFVSKKLHSIDLNSGEEATVELPNDRPFTGGRNHCFWARRGNSNRLHLVREGNAWVREGEEWKWLAGANAEVEAKLTTANHVAARVFRAGERDSEGYLPSSIVVWSFGPEQGKAPAALYTVPVLGEVDFALSSDGSKLSIAKGNEVELYSVGKPDPESTAKMETPVSQMDWAPNDRYLVAITDDGKHSILDGRNLTTLKELEKPGRRSPRGGGWQDHRFHHGALPWSSDAGRFVRTPTSEEVSTSVAGVIVDAEGLE